MQGISIMKLLWTCLLLSAVLQFSAVLGATRCNKVCMPNSVQCKTSQTYQVCINGEPYGDVQPCPADTYCSDSANVCLPASNTTVEFVCGTENNGPGLCGECEAGDMFTCMDRTHFTMCNNRDAYVSCGTGKICVKELLKISDLICVPPLVATQLGLGPSCTSTSTTTAAPPPVTPAMTDAIAACTTAYKQGVTSSGSYFFIPNPLDSTCRTFIYCAPKTGGMEALSMRCTDDRTYYDNAKQKCVDKFVQNCDSTTTSAKLLLMEHS